MDRKCAICEKSSSLFTIEIPPEEEGELPFNRHICISCWEIIAQVSLKAVEVNFDKLMKIYWEKNHES